MPLSPIACANSSTWRVVQRALAGVESTLSITVAPRRTISAAFVPAGTDQAYNVRLHDELKNSVGDRPQEVASVLSGQKRG